jgi:hypothetical protein
MENLQPPFDRPETWIAVAVGIIVLISIVGAAIRTLRCLFKVVIIGIVLGLILMVIGIASGII